jgi:GNAT superfamily N-acetyltransferase
MILGIKQIEPHDVPSLVAGGKLFFDEFKLPGEFNKESFVINWQRLIRSESGIVLALVDPIGKVHGAIGSVVNLDLNTGDRIAVEMFYYAFPTARGKASNLLKAMEEAARGRGCKRVWMICLENDRVEGMVKFYERGGYVPKERLFMKELV